jgi:hypothetical protein
MPDKKNDILSHFHISCQNSKISWQKMGTILVKSALNALKIEVFKQKVFFIEEIQFSGTFFVIDIFWKLQFLKAFKALFTKIVPIFCQLILEFC